MRTCQICNSDMRFKYKLPSGKKILICNYCGYEILDKLPSDEELIALYNSSYYESYGNFENVMKQKTKYFDFILDKLKIKPESKILEVGCGTGFFLNVCKKRGHDVYGIDINQGGLNIAKRYVDDSKLFCLPFEEFNSKEKFDAIFMLDYIEHVKNQKEVLEIALNKLNSFGVLVIVTPSPSSVSNKLMGCKWPHYTTEHLSFFSKKSIGFLLKQIGYSDIQVDNCNKILALDYLYSQIIGKSMAIAQVARFFYRLVPYPLREKNISLGTGDIVVVAKKQGPAFNLLT